jgi:hypothetical protein
MRAIIQNVPAWGNAARELKKLGVHFDRVIVPQGFHEVYYTKEVVPYDLLHYYFMQGDCDVAYWTPIMNTLAVLKQPRLWDKKIITRSRVVNPWVEGGMP